MNAKHFLGLAITGLWVIIAIPSVAEIPWRMSVKLVLGPGFQQIPNYGGNAVDPFVGVSNNVHWINVQLADNGSPYQIELIEVMAVSGMEDFYDREVDATSRDEMQANATEDPDLYAWRDDAINVYILGTMSGTYAGYCSISSNNHAILLRADSSVSTFFHELGHFFDLRHTHVGSNYRAADGCEAPYEAGGGDLCEDTLPDHPCFDRDGIAENYYLGLPYGDLLSDQQQLVDNTWFNLMSYHHEGTLITSDQWERVEVASNEWRNHVVGRRHWFVDLENTCTTPNGSRRCAYTSFDLNGVLRNGGGPFPTVGEGLDAAEAGDLLRIRTGSYQETLTISQSITLRAEGGSVIIH